MNVDAALVAKLLQIGLFSIPLIISPGPNNLMTTANCAQFGYRRTLPSLTGISVGVFVLFMVIALGLSSVLSRYPLLHPALKVVGTAYILYRYLQAVHVAADACRESLDRASHHVR